ncbi:MAG: sugar transferase [bacterium]
MAAHRSYLQKQMIWLGALDALCLIVGVIAGVAIRLGPEEFISHIDTYISGWFYLAVAVLASNYITGSYGLELRLSRFNMAVNWVFSMTMAILVVSITSYAWLNAILGRGVLALAVGVYSFLWLTLRLLIYHYLFRKDPLAYRVAILGTGSRAKADRALVQDFDLRPKHKVVAMIQIEQGQKHLSSEPGVLSQGHSNAGEGSIIHCSPAHVAATVRMLNCDVLLVAVEREEELAGVYPQMRRLRFEGVSVLSPLNVAEVYCGKVPLTLVDEHWLMHASQGHVTPMAMRFKRIADIFLIILMSPVVIYLGVMVALIVKLSEPRSPVFYMQERVGRFGRIFKIFKFRTMRPGAELKDGAVWSPVNDSRITWAGRSLRKYRLDELPQLWNVLKGEMSLVGPRPERPELVEKLEKVVPYYRERENLLPGLTGWAQIRYPYGATIEDARSKLEYDLYYLQNLSMALDLRILLRTLRIVLFGMERVVR